MSSTAVDSPVAAALSRLRVAVDELLALPHESLTDDDELDVARGVETAKRRLVPVDHAVINQLATRSVAFDHGARSTAVFLSQLLRIARTEAAARVKAAEVLGHRCTMTGEPVGPQFPLVAAAQAEGVLSDRHAAVITRTVEKLPTSVQEEFGDFVEQTLVDQARGVDPTVLHRHADALSYVLDQDGQYRDHEHQERVRGFNLHRRVDGSSRLEGELTAECTEHLLTHFDALAKPAPAANGAPDPRTASQQRHDAFLEMLKLVERAELLPDAGGVSATIVLHLDADAYATARGRATTGHGYAVPADVAKRWAGAEARVMAVLLTKTKAVSAYSTTQRIVTEGQRLALIARDKGCSFPGCDVKPAWTQAHHVTEWQHSRRTSVDDCTLLCGFHHRSFEQLGWSCRMTAGHPYWIAPKWLDPDQTPHRNTLHD